MRIAVVVTPKASKNKVEGLRRDASGRQEVVCRVTPAPEGGKATKAVCELVADELGLPKSKVRCVRGSTARHKQLEVDCSQETVSGWVTSLQEL
jgi:uncharacterized protein YggU (UPF0235/DUF167 family)